MFHLLSSLLLQVARSLRWLTNQGSLSPAAPCLEGWLWGKGTTRRGPSGEKALSDLHVGRPSREHPHLVTG